MSHRAGKTAQSVKHLKHKCELKFPAPMSKPSIATHTYNPPSVREVETGGFPELDGQSSSLSEEVSPRFGKSGPDC